LPRCRRVRGKDPKWVLRYDIGSLQWRKAASEEKREKRRKEECWLLLLKNDPSEGESKGKKRLKEGPGAALTENRPGKWCWSKELEKSPGQSRERAQLEKEKSQSERSKNINPGRGHTRGGASVRIKDGNKTSSVRFRLKPPYPQSSGVNLVKLKEGDRRREGGKGGNQKVCPAREGGEGGRISTQQEKKIGESPPHKTPRWKKTPRKKGTEKEAKVRDRGKEGGNGRSLHSLMVEIKELDKKPRTRVEVSVEILPKGRGNAGKRGKEVSGTMFHDALL